MDKKDVIYKIKYYSAIKKKEWNLAIWTEDKYCMISLTFGIEKTKQLTKNNKTVIDTENKQEVSGGKEDGEWKK